jgi:hypothetical protein
MHPVIPHDELSKLTLEELLCLEAALRDVILHSPLNDADLRRCLQSLSNVVEVLTLRSTPQAAYHVP